MKIILVNVMLRQFLCDRRTRNFGSYQPLVKRVLSPSATSRSTCQINVKSLISSLTEKNLFQMQMFQHDRQNKNHSLSIDKYLLNQYTGLVDAFQIRMLV